MSTDPEKSVQSVSGQDDRTYLLDKERDESPNNDAFEIYYVENGPYFKRRMFRRYSSSSPGRGRGRFCSEFCSRRLGPFWSSGRFVSGSSKKYTDSYGNIFPCRC